MASGLSGAANDGPGAKAAVDVGHIAHAHVHQGFGGQRAAPAGGAKEHKFLLFAEDGLEIRGIRIDPEFNHAARRMKGAGDHAFALQFARHPSGPYAELGRTNLAKLEAAIQGETNRQLKAALQRVGCFEGEITSEWDIAARRAMQKL